MAENQTMENANMPSEEEKREFEANFLRTISEAEKGDEERRKFLSEMSNDEILVMYKVCTPETILRLAEYHCLSQETLLKGFAICGDLRKTLDQSPDFFSKDTAPNVKRFCTFATLLGYVVGNIADCEKPGMATKLQNAITDICKLAESGYALAQYWMGVFAELDIDYGNADKPAVDRWTRATKYYRRASAQGCFPARNALKEIPAKREQNLLEERKERRCAGKCQHCGGNFKGLFKKVCSSCGKPKDY